MRPEDGQADKDRQSRNGKETERRRREAVKEEEGNSMAVVRVGGRRRFGGARVLWGDGLGMRGGRRKGARVIEPRHC